MSAAIPWLEAEQFFVNKVLPGVKVEPWQGMYRILAGRPVPYMLFHIGGEVSSESADRKLDSLYIGPTVYDGSDGEQLEGMDLDQDKHCTGTAVLRDADGGSYRSVDLLLIRAQLPR